MVFIVIFDEKPMATFYVNSVAFLITSLYCEIKTPSFENMFY